MTDPKGGMTAEDLWKKYDQALKEITEIKANNPSALARARARIVALADQIQSNQRSKAA